MNRVALKLQNHYQCVQATALNSSNLCLNTLHCDWLYDDGEVVIIASLRNALQMGEGRVVVFCLSYTRLF